MYVAEKTRNYTIFALKFFVFVFENNFNIQITDLIPKQFLKILFFKTKKSLAVRIFLLISLSTLREQVYPITGMPLQP